MTAGRSADAPRLPHVRADGSAHMVDVGGKPITVRRARAEGRVLLSSAAVAALREGTVPKGDALVVARIAGLQAAKRTPQLVPLAHPVAVHSVEVDLDVVDDGVEITAVVGTADRTGIEMEALTCVTVAALGLIDMIKAVDKHARITDVRVTAKSGGRSGDWAEGDLPAPQQHHDAPELPEQAGAGHPQASAPLGPAAGGEPGAPAEPSGSAGAGRGGESGANTPTRPGTATSGDRFGAGKCAAIVTCSTRAAAGVYPDRAGSFLAERLAGWGFGVDGPYVVPDGEAVGHALRQVLAAGVDLVLTTGGTGLTATDSTPEQTLPLLDRQIPGVADAVRAAGIAAGVPAAVLSRGVAGLAGRALVVNLPGSLGGARDGVAALEPVLAHALDQVAGGDH